tara:strand:+ start:5824 stop:6540 length:717 start_codon:yes stop_codon:yes gene_type:complete
MPSTGDTLSLGALGNAVDANANSTTQTALAKDGAGSPGTLTKLSDFAVSSITGPIISDTTPNEGQSYIITVQFGTVGSKFLSRIASLTSNFVWQEVSNTSKYTLTISSDYTAGCTMSSVSSNQSCTIKCKFNDGFNHHATNWGTFINESFTIQNLGGGAGGGKSDIRLKENIDFIGYSKSNIPIYEFNYIGKPERYQGTMAQDLLNMNLGDAVVLDNDGYFNVLYNKIDVEFKQLEIA